MRGARCQNIFWDALSLLPSLPALLLPPPLAKKCHRDIQFCAIENAHTSLFALFFCAVVFLLGGVDTEFESHSVRNRQKTKGPAPLFLLSFFCLLILGSVSWSFPELPIRPSALCALLLSPPLLIPNMPRRLFLLLLLRPPPGITYLGIVFPPPSPRSPAFFFPSRSGQFSAPLLFVWTFLPQSASSSSCLFIFFSLRKCGRSGFSPERSNLRKSLYECGFFERERRGREKATKLIAPLRKVRSFAAAPNKERKNVARSYKEKEASPLPFNLNDSEHT